MNTAAASLAPAAQVEWQYDAASNIRSEVATSRALDAQGNVSGAATTQGTWYLYDTMNRMTRQGSLSGTQIVRDAGAARGIDILYDGAGQRVQTTRTEREMQSGNGGVPYYLTRSVREVYAFNLDGTLHDLHRIEGSYAGGDETLTGTGWQQSYYAYNAMGWLTIQKDYDASGAAIFRRAGNNANPDTAIGYDNAGRNYGDRELQ